METREKVDGVVIGLLLGFEDGAPLVVFPGNPVDRAVPARSLRTLAAADTGSEVALMFEDGDAARPLVVGRIVDPVRSDAPDVIRDGQTVKVTAEERLELRVGKSSIVLEADGRITIRGTNVTSQASRANRLRGGSIQLN